MSGSGFACSPLCARRRKAGAATKMATPRGPCSSLQGSAVVLFCLCASCPFKNILELDTRLLICVFLDL